MDFRRCGEDSGTRFVWLKGALARLERWSRAIHLDLHTATWLSEIAPPVLCATGHVWQRAQLPKFRGDQFEAATNSALHFMRPWKIESPDPLTILAPSGMMACASVRSRPDES